MHTDNPTVITSENLLTVTSCCFTTQSIINTGTLWVALEFELSTSTLQIPTFWKVFSVVNDQLNRRSTDGPVCTILIDACFAYMCTVPPWESPRLLPETIFPFLFQSWWLKPILSVLLVSSASCSDENPD